MFIGHGTLVAAAVEVAHCALLKVPGGADVHCRLVVSAEETAYLELGALKVRQAVPNAHLAVAFLFEQVFPVAGNLGHHIAEIVDADDRLFRHGGVVAAAVGIGYGAAMNVDKALGQLGNVETLLPLVSDLRGDGVGIALFEEYLVGDFIVSSWSRSIVVVAVAAAEELANKDFLVALGQCGGSLDVIGCLAECRIARLCIIYLFLRIMNGGIHF